MTAIRLTKPTLAVLDILIASTDDNPPWGLSICHEADLGPGTVYPILDRLKTLGWVTTRVEEEPHPGRPPRMYYTLTGAGRAEAGASIAARSARRRGALRFTGGMA
ncbi:PadR family transcriptional regulator [Streptomyces sp. NPDC056503]|uniref:PadR family transcriptional regulator n=1 Tax=Streptomyces sp. NPDC056503 TaxID=3345842 RepID=UPI003684493F